MYPLLFLTGTAAGFVAETRAGVDVAISDRHVVGDPVEQAVDRVEVR